MQTTISIAKCGTYDSALVFEAVKKAVGLIGGISGFVRPGSKVLVKPNLLMAKEPEFGIDTHPEVVRAVVKLLKEINCRILIGDGPSVWGRQAENIDDVYQRTGIAKVARDEGVELVKFEKRRWRGKFPLTTWLDECEHLVSVPKFKTHGLTILTGAIKNLFGLVSGSYKTELHKKYFALHDFAKMLVDVYSEAQPNLTIIDGIVAMEGDGPASGGKLRNAGLIMAGSDGVALDSVLALIMGLAPCDIPTTREAVKRGLGVSEPDSIRILGESLEVVRGKPFILPGDSLVHKIPRPIIDIAKKIIRFTPAIKRKNCTLCQSCLQACPNQAISMKSNKVAIDYSKCISCFCCVEACPDAAIKVKKGLFTKIIGL